MIVNFKRGDTFEAVVRLRDDMGALVDLVAGGITCISQIRDSEDVLIQQLSVANDTAPTGKVLSATPAQTAAWPVAQLLWDVQWSKDGRVFSTETLTIDVEKDVTQP